MMRMHLCSRWQPAPCALPLRWCHGARQRQLNGMQVLFSLRIEKVNSEVQHIQIEYPVCFLSSRRSLSLVPQRWDLFLRVTFWIPLSKFCFDPLWRPALTHLFRETPWKRQKKHARLGIPGFGQVHGYAPALEGCLFPGLLHRKGEA